MPQLESWIKGIPPLITDIHTLTAAAAAALASPAAAAAAAAAAATQKQGLQHPDQPRLPERSQTLSNWPWPITPFVAVR